MYPVSLSRIIYFHTCPSRATHTWLSISATTLERVTFIRVDPPKGSVPTIHLKTYLVFFATMSYSASFTFKDIIFVMIHNTEISFSVVVVGMIILPQCSMASYTH